MASELAIIYTLMHFMWGVKSGATPGYISETIRCRKLILGSDIGSG